MTHEEISQSTRFALAESLKAWMQKKPLSKITVGDITNACNMNRKTFYYHFKDIYELYIWILEQEVIQFAQNFDSTENLDALIQYAFDYIENNTHLISCAYDSMGQEGMRKFLYKDFEIIVKKLILSAESEKELIIDDKYRQFLCLTYIEIIAGVIISYLKGELKISKDETICYLVNFLKNTIPNALNRF